MIMGRSLAFLAAVVLAGSFFVAVIGCQQISRVPVGQAANSATAMQHTPSKNVAENGARRPTRESLPFFCGANSEDIVLNAEVEGRTLVVTLENKTGNDVIFWELGNMWGDGSFYLVLQDRETKEIVVSQYGQKVYGRPLVSDIQLIRSGTKVEFRIDLDHGWNQDKAMRDDRYQLKSLILSSEINEKTIWSEVFLDRLYFHFPSEE